MEILFTWHNASVAALTSLKLILKTGLVRCIFISSWYWEVSIQLPSGLELKGPKREPQVISHQFLTMDVPYYYASSSSSSASPAPPRYEVVLSFRGEDAREHLADPLATRLAAKRISVFRDEEVGPALVEAIGQSKISIPIISPEYASSENCLWVLAQMLECRDAMNHAIVPIFYRLNPFADHRKRASDGMLLDPLKSALLRVGQLEGYRLDNASDR